MHRAGQPVNVHFFKNISFSTHRAKPEERTVLRETMPA